MDKSRKWLPGIVIMTILLVGVLVIYVLFYLKGISYYDGFSAEIPVSTEAEEVKMERAGSGPLGSYGLDPYTASWNDQ